PACGIFARSWLRGDRDGDVAHHARRPRRRRERGPPLLPRAGIEYRRRAHHPRKQGRHDAMTRDVAATVRSLLEAAQLTVSDEEFELFVKTYPDLRAGADAMYLPEVRYEEPALNFDARWDTA